LSRQKIGEIRGFNVSGGFSSTSDRVSAVSGLFRMYGRPIEMDFRFDRPAFDKLYLQGKLNVAKADTVKVSMKAEGDNDDGQFFQKPGGRGVRE
jgi:hypothetical protein